MEKLNAELNCQSANIYCDVNFIQNNTTREHHVLPTQQLHPKNESNCAEGRIKVSKRISKSINGSFMIENYESGTITLSQDRKKSNNVPRRFRRAGSGFIPLANSNLRRKRKIEIRDIMVLKGGLATLPCTLTPNSPNDSVQIVLWIKEGVHTPLYSYDYRVRLGGRPKETKPDTNSSLARRTSFRTDSIPAALEVERVVAADAGIYRCRVDYEHEQTKNVKINLTVIVPPSRAKIMWKLKRGASHPIILAPGSEGVIGPFTEGRSPIVTCSNNDGIPTPSVIWYERDLIIDKTYQYNKKTKAVENSLTLESLKRTDHDRRLTCVASNTNRTQPATTTIKISMILKILQVKVGDVSNLAASKERDITCKVWGSRPSPNIIWWLGSKSMQSTHVKTLEDGNLTLAVLSFTPNPTDDGAMLICQASNDKLKDYSMQDSRLLSVSYIPQVKVALGTSLDASQIKEGDDVYFECTVKAKPIFTKIQWKHNGKELMSENGIFVSNMSLVVQKVTRDNGGEYTCHSTNTMGTGVSDPLNLDVKYAPVCSTNDKMQHSVAKLENAEIACHVSSNPSNVTFRWTFNNTAEAIDVPEGRFVVTGTESIVNYTPMNELDYGTLLCWANNSIGIQEKPCVFQIVPAGKPQPPHNCRVYDLTISSLQVKCLAGDDGGLVQKFMLQVYEIGSKSPIVEQAKDVPTFSVTNLRPATAYKLSITALNEKGASKKAELKTYTEKVVETQEETSAEPARERDRDKTEIPLVMIIGAAVAAIPTLFLVIGIIYCKRCRKTRELMSDEEVSNSNEKNKNLVLSGTSSSMLKTSGHDGSDSIDGGSMEIALSLETPPDDRNPDLISNTPDPSDGTDPLIGGISTISHSGYFMTNGGIAYPQTSTTSSSVGNRQEYLQLACQSGRIHQTMPRSMSIQSTGISNESHCRGSRRGSQNYQSCGDYPQDDRSHFQQQPILDVPLPPPASYNQGYRPVMNPCKDANSSYQCQIPPQHFSQNIAPFPHLYINKPGLSENEAHLPPGHMCPSRSYEGYLDDLSATSTLPRAHFNNKCGKNGSWNVRMAPENMDSERTQHFGTIRRKSNAGNSSGSRKGSKKSLTASTSDICGISSDGLQPLIKPHSPNKSKRESAV